MGDSDDDYDNRRSRDKFRRERQGKDYDMDRTRDKNDGDNKSRSSWNDRGRSDNRRNNDDNRRSSRYSPVRNRDYSPPQMKRMRHDTWEDSGPPPPQPPQNGGEFMPSPMPPHHWQPPHPHDPMFHMGGMYNNQFVPNPNMQPQQQRPMQSHIEDNTGQTVIMTFKQFIINEPDDITDTSGVQKYQDYKNDVRGQQICEFFTQHKKEEWFRIKYHPSESLKHENELRKALQKRKDVYFDLQSRGIMNDMSFDLGKTSLLERILNSAVVLMEGGEDEDLEAILDDIKDDEPAKEVPLPKEPEKKEELEDKESKEDKEDKDEGIEDTENKMEEEEEDDDGQLSEEDDEENGKDEKKKDSAKEEEDTKKKEDDVSNEKPEKIVDTSISVMYKTQSIFLRNLAPTITKREVEAMCKKFTGYKRVAIQDPQSDRKFYRRGWVTFESNVNIKEICFSLTNIRLRECEMGAIINRDLKQRIRPVSGIVSHRTIAIQDLKNSIKIIKNYDDKWKIWNPNALKKVKVEGDDDLVDGELPRSVKSKEDEEEEVILDEYVDKDSEKNYLIRDAIEYLNKVDEKVQEADGEEMMNHDDALIKLLDKLLMYLRIVYSFDYFAAIEYPNEDEMPHRCGIAHARASLPVNKISKNDVSEWIAAFELRISPFINMSSKITEENAVKLGKKIKKLEVEKFVEANTQELGQNKDKWLCPLSGKKFKGADFVRKHIFNKHGDKVETVRNDVEFFNNFLNDIHRPGLPEVAPQSGRTSTYRNNQANPTFNARRTPQQMAPQRNPMIRPFGTPRGGGDMWRPRLDRRSDPRAVIAYHDLDAPAE